MKYIRTKDKKGKQYIVSDRDYFFQIKDNKAIFTYGYEEELLGQANTIEELCDELVLKDLDTEMCFTMSAVHIQDIRDNWKNLMDNDYLKSHTIYGAIWTDKGLIYVAKMNEKGELELL